VYAKGEQAYGLASNDCYYVFDDVYFVDPEGEFEVANEGPNLPIDVIE